MCLPRTHAAAPRPRLKKWACVIVRTFGPPSSLAVKSSAWRSRALVKEPALIFADEPTSALDKTNGQIVIDLLKRIAREHGVTVLGVTHDPRLLSHADRVIHLEDGVVVRDEKSDVDTYEPRVTAHA